MARIATHRVCEDHHRLDLRELARSGLLNGSGALTWADGHQVTINGHAHTAIVVGKFGRRVRR